MCTILCRFAEAMGYDLTVEEGLAYFRDEIDIADYAYKSVYRCADAGIVKGMTETHFMPKESATRAQACAILQRFIRLTTTTVHEVSTVNGMTVYAYMDKYGVYAEEHFTVNKNGDPVERAYSDGVYRERETWSYNENGDIVEYKYTDSEGDEDRVEYTYNEDGSLGDVRRTNNGETVSLSLLYVEGTEQIGAYAVTDPDGVETVVFQVLSEDGSVEVLQITESNGVETSSYIFEYNEYGSLSYLKMRTSEVTIESVEGSFEEGLPTELTLIYRGETYDVSINWWAAHADVTLNGVSQIGSGDMVLRIIGSAVGMGDDYEVVTPDNVADLLY